MYSSGAKRVMDSINTISKKADGDPVLLGYNTTPYNSLGFRNLEPQEGLLAFIDGGNAEILHTPAFSVFLIRIYYSVFNNGIKTGAKRHEFYALSWIEPQDGCLAYKSRFFPLTDVCVMPLENDLSFGINDPTIKDGIFAADIGKMGGIIRKFAEWKIASSITEKHCITLKDGTLQAGITNESAYADSAYRNSEEKGGCIASVAKTSTILTTTGNNFHSVLQKRAPFGSWQYFIGDNKNTGVHAIKFHPSSRHVFRVDIEKRADASNVMSIIASNCSDYRFPGYPYGLIDADAFARVTETEKAHHKALFMSAMKDHRTHISSEDAHDILNSFIS